MSTRNTSTKSTKSAKENTMNATITLTPAQIEALTQLLAIASAQNTQSNAPTKAAKTRKSNAPKKTAKTGKSNAPKKVEKPALALEVFDDGKSVRFNQYAPHVLWASNDKIAQSLNGAYDRTLRAWVFKSKQSAQKFVENAIVSMSDGEYAEAKAEISAEREDKIASRKRSAEEVQSYKDAYAEMWNAWVADCASKGIKRTSAMNKNASADIRGTLANRA